jgi:alpha-galactosidase
MTNVLVQGLTVEASFTGDPELVMNAVALDPLTASVLTLKEIREMVAEMLEAESKYLPQFAGKTLRSVPAISIPKDVRRAEVPLDPALAIANRFMKLAGAYGTLFSGSHLNGGATLGGFDAACDNHRNSNDE